MAKCPTRSEEAATRQGLQQQWRPGGTRTAPKFDFQVKMTSETDPTDEQWKAVRELLKQGPLAAEIPVNGTEMRPKAVWQKCKINGDQEIECVHCENAQV